MIPFDTLVLFFTAATALAFAPGPDNIFVLTQSAMLGRKAGLLVTLGLCSGLLVHTAAVTLGVAAIFQSSELAFNVLKAVGALYLLYLAFQAFRAGATELGQEGKQLSAYNLYLRGVVMNVTNPKVAIFFLAFLPQFSDPSRGDLSTQIVLFGACFILTTFLVFGAIAWFSGFLGSWLKRSAKAQVILNRVAGTVFVALAVRLAFSAR